MIVLLLYHVNLFFPEFPCPIIYMPSFDEFELHAKNQSFLHIMYSVIIHLCEWWLRTGLSLYVIHSFPFSLIVYYHVQNVI